MPLFEVAIIQRPTKKEEEDGAVEKLLLDPTWVIAKNQDMAVAQALRRAVKTLTDEQMDRAEGLVRPF